MFCEVFRVSCRRTCFQPPSSALFRSSMSSISSALNLLKSRFSVFIRISATTVHRKRHRMKEFRIANQWTS